MKKIKLTTEHLNVLKVLETEHLTSFQILMRIESISLILVLYNIMDDLIGMGIIKSYTKKDEKLHYTC